MEIAKESGALLSFDPNLRIPLWPSADEARKQIMSIWDQADIIKVSDNELEFLTGSDKIDDASALSLWRPNMKLMLVTCGEKGCNYYTKVDTYHSIEPAVLVSFCFILVMIPMLVGGYGSSFNVPVEAFFVVLYRIGAELDGNADNSNEL